MKKQLLNEQEIRKFMKFAEIGSLADSVIERLDEGGMMYKDDDEEEVKKEGMGMAYKDDEEEGDMPMGAPEGGEEEGALGDAPPEDEMGAAEPAPDMGAGGGGSAKEDLQQILQAMADKAGELGIDVEVEGEAGAGAMDVQGGDEGEEADLAGLGGEPEAEDAPPVGAKAEDDEEPMEEDIFLEDDSDLVNEVARRVARRLMSAKRNHKRRGR